MGIMMLITVSAIYPGMSQTYSNEMGSDNLIYTIVGNSSPVEIEVTLNASNITIYLPSGAAPDNFYLVFFEKETNTVVQTIYTSGGGSSRTIYKDKVIRKNIPIYTNKIEEVEVEVEKIVDKVELVETGYELWHIIMAIIATIIIATILFLLRGKEE